jgi:hypothetical protein
LINQHLYLHQEATITPLHWLQAHSQSSSDLIIILQVWRMDWAPSQRFAFLGNHSTQFKCICFSGFVG